jgi:hypothetical protein
MSTRVRLSISIIVARCSESNLRIHPNMAHQRRNFAAALAKYATGAFPTVKEPWYFLDGQLYPSMPSEIPYGAGLLREVRLHSITRSFSLTWHLDAQFSVSTPTSTRSSSTSNSSGPTCPIDVLPGPPWTQPASSYA